MSLYSITEKYLTVFNNAIDPETGEFRENSLADLETIEAEFREKGLAVAYHFKNLEAEAVMIEAAMCDMEQRRDALKKKAEYFRQYLKDNMERKGITELSCAYFVARLHKGREELEVHDEKFIPNEYWKKKETFSIDRIRLKKELKDGKEINGVSLKRRPSLVIR